MQTEVIFRGLKHVGSDLSTVEEKLLADELAKCLAAPDSFKAWLYKENMAAIKGGLEVAKNKLDAGFGGMAAGDAEIAMQDIRPGHILRTTGTTETPSNDWTFSFAADADYWIGYGTNNTTSINIDKELLLLALGVWFTQGANPVVEELLIKVGATDYPVEVIRDAWAADNPWGIRAMPIKPLLLVPKDTCLVQSYSIEAGTQELVLLGLAFGMGRLLRKQSFTSVSL